MMLFEDLISQIRHLEIFTKKNVTEVFAGNYASSFRGQGLEVSDIREYEEGDDIRHVDWITTAKQGKVFIKRFQETRELTTILLIDVSASMNFSSSEKRKKDVAIELTAILLFSALKNGDKFGALLFSDDIEIYIPPKKGKSHVLRILREILVRYENNQYKKSDMQKALHFLNNVVPRHSLCFCVSDFIDTSVQNDLRISRSKYDFVFFHIVDPFEKGIIHDDVLMVEDPETGEQSIVHLGKKDLKKKFQETRAQKYTDMKKMLQKNRVDMVEFLPTSNIYKELLLFFKRRQVK